MQMVPIPPPAESDFGRLRMDPPGSRRRGAHPGMILELQEPLWAGASSVSEGKIKKSFVHPAFDWKERHWTICIGDFCCVSSTGKLFWSLKWKKPP